MKQEKDFTLKTKINNQLQLNSLNTKSEKLLQKEPNQISHQSEQAVKTTKKELTDLQQKQSETLDQLHNLQNQIMKKKEKAKNLRSQFLTGQIQELEKDIQTLEIEIQELEIKTQKVQRRKLKVKEVQQEIHTQALHKALNQRLQEHPPHRQTQEEIHKHRPEIQEAQEAQEIQEIQQDQWHNPTLNPSGKSIKSESSWID